MHKNTIFYIQKTINNVYSYEYAIPVGINATVYSVKENKKNIKSDLEVKLKNII